MALVKMAEEFGGLPMESLIGGPLQAACDAQTMLGPAQRLALLKRSAWLRKAINRSYVP